MREYSGKYQEVFETDRTWRLLLQLSIPSVLTTLIMLLYNLADVFFIGQLQDRTQVAAVSLCSPIFSLVSSLGMLFGNGGCIRCASLLGKKDHDSVRSVSSFCFWGGLVTGVLLSFCMTLFLSRTLTLLGASEQTGTPARGYLSVMVSGIPLMLFCQSISALLRSDGEVRMPMYGNMIGSVSNILLDPLLILVMGRGVRGAAEATIIANALNALWLIMLLYRKRGLFSVSLKDLKLRWDVTGGVLLLGLPMMINTLLTSFSGVLNNRFLTGYGDLFLAANGVSSKLRMILSMLIMGICLGIQPAISYYHGAKDRARMKNILRVTLLCTTAIGIALSIGFYVFRDGLISLFINDPEVIKYGSIMVIGSMIAGPLHGILQLSISYLQGTGSVTMATGFSLFRQLIHILLLALMNAAFGFMGLVFSSSATTFVCAATGVVLCAVQIRKNGFSFASSMTEKQND
ncbi:MAG: MATE family efflux transporter [Clostridia bacterium]|nr:MATE family efflux transporter [Clostridia bacterium]